MAVKGYTREEMAEAIHKKRIRAFYMVAAAIVVLIAANIVLAILSMGTLAFITLLIFLALFVIFVRGIGMLDEEGHDIKRLKLIKNILLIVYVVSALVAFLSM